ncbi:MAG: heavy metal translocating P-type ATPase [Eubacteriaceae bacterium]|nr:heavy metal translocating P-type ATPase [Eubacteriaceae bacterium]
MRYSIQHRSKNRLHINLVKSRLNDADADALYYALIDAPAVRAVSVKARTARVVLQTSGDVEALLTYMDHLDYTTDAAKENVPAQSARALNAEYSEKLIMMILTRSIKRLLLPMPIRRFFHYKNALPYILQGLKTLIIERRVDVTVLDATAVAAALLTGDFGTAGSTTFLLKIGELLEEWTYKKSVGDLAQSLSLNVTKVWRVEGEKPELVAIDRIKAGDVIRVGMGNMIPLDGVVRSGVAMVNQAALTGESVAVAKKEGLSVYAGTVVEEGELDITIDSVSGDTRYDKIMQMIASSENMAADSQNKASELADKLVPFSFIGAALTYALTRNISRTTAVLMVDYSCALKLSMPISVLSAMREAGKNKITVKGGKFLELFSEADTIVFDKTGTLTKATPTLKEVIVMDGNDETEMLRIAACLEEHFPHSMANAVVRAARQRGISHDEMHSDVEYIVAHGIVSTIDEKRVIIGSYHFAFEDEKVKASDEALRRIADIPDRYSRLYLAIDGRLAAVIVIEDPIKEDAADIVGELKKLGINHIVMMTGDSEKTAAAVAKAAGIDEYYSEVLPEDKARFVEAEKAKGRKVVMVGDGINDSPALSAADVGIAMKEGADIAAEIADITLSGHELAQLVTLKKLSDALMREMKVHGRVILTVNSALMIAGAFGVLAPAPAALLHNTSTVAICLRSMGDLLEA